MDPSVSFIKTLLIVSLLNVVISDGIPEKNYITDYFVRNLPDEFDAPEAWPHCETIKVIQDRGECGSAWAITVASVISDRVS